MEALLLTIEAMGFLIEKTEGLIAARFFDNEGFIRHPDNSRYAATATLMQKDKYGDWFLRTSDAAKRVFINIRQQNFFYEGKGRHNVKGTYFLLPLPERLKHARDEKK